MPHLPRLLQNFASTIGMRVVSAAASFALFVLLARRWETTALGEFATVYAFFLFLQQLPLLGLQIPIIRDLARRPDTLNEIGASAALLGMGGAAVLGVTLGMIGEFLYPQTMQPALWLVGAAFVPGALVSLGESVLMAQERMGRVAVISAGESLLRAGAWFVLVSFGYGLTALFVTLIFLRTVTLVPYFASKSLRSILRPGNFRRDVAARLLRLSPTFLGILVLAAGISRLDVIMLSLLGTLEQVALYSAPYKVYEAILMVPSALALSFFPLFARTHSQSSERQFEDLARQLIRACVTIGLPCAVALAFLAASVVWLFFGSGFLSASVVLVVLAFAPVLFAMEQTLTNVLLAAGHEGLDLKVLAWTCAYYLVALAVLIPPAGFRGATFATASAAALQLVLRYATVRTRLGMRSMVGIVLRPSIAALLMSVVVYVLHPVSLGVALAAGGVIYLAALAMLRAVTIADVRWIRGSLQQSGGVW